MEGQIQLRMAKPEGSILPRAQCSRPLLPLEGGFGAGPSGEGEGWGQVATLPEVLFPLPAPGSTPVTGKVCRTALAWAWLPRSQPQ